MVDLLFHELLHFVQNPFSGLFWAMFSHISNNEIKTHLIEGAILAVMKKCTEIVAADLNLLGSVGDLYYSQYAC